MRNDWMRGVVLFVILGTACAAQAADNDVVTLTHLSRMFSDASASGDAKTLNKLLDDNVVFMGEDGSHCGKHDIVTGASPPPKGISNKLVQSDFAVQLHGDVAVTSFTDNATFNTYGQVAHEHFRSTEVWLKENDSWKMISSQTLAVPQDPPQSKLSQNDLDQYLGDYMMVPGHAIRIERRGDELVRIGKDHKPVPLLTEVRDVMFTAGQPRVRLIFERNHAGRVTGFNVRREGIDIQRFTRG